MCARKGVTLLVALFCVCVWEQHIAYLGNVEFAPGQWVGVVLNRPTGLIDGCVMNKSTGKKRKYFDCKPNFVSGDRVCGASNILTHAARLCTFFVLQQGLFVRPRSVAVRHGAMHSCAVL